MKILDTVKRYRTDIKYVGITLIIATTLFFVGRCTAPPSPDANARKIDSLKKVNKGLEILQIVEHRRAEVAQQIAKDHEADKIKFQEKFLASEARIKTLTRAQKEMVLKKVGGVSKLDSSFVTDSLSTNLLTLSNAFTKCLENGEADALTVISMRDSYNSLDSAYEIAEKRIENKDGIILQQSKAKRRTKWWTWPAVIGGTVLGFILGSL